FILFISVITAHTLSDSFTVPFSFNHTATTAIYTLSLHDALPISPAHRPARPCREHRRDGGPGDPRERRLGVQAQARAAPGRHVRDRKSTRLNSSHSQNSYAVFCLKKKKIKKKLQKL